MNPAATPGDVAAATNGYARFMIIAAARTGSNMLVQALNSNPHVRCFGEIFNTGVDSVLFNIDGYDNFNDRERELRDSDYTAFLRDRIFGAFPSGIHAVGFKLLYAQDWRFPGLVWRLAEDNDLRVVHLRRRNLLRSIVSGKIAERTGVWLEPSTVLAGTFRPANALRAARHPGQAAAALLRRLRLLLRRREASATRLTLSVEECTNNFQFIQAHERSIDEMFSAHPLLTLFYEELLERPEELFDTAQSFLGLEPTSLSTTSRQQNPEPLQDLLTNYEQLREALSGTPYATFFE